MKQIKKLSVVTTVYYSANVISEFYRRMKKCAETVSDDFEIIFVNDGSPDHSLQVLKNLAQSEPKLKVVDLSRNFGHHTALMTGLTYASGSHIFMLDVDLEESPELLYDYVETYFSDEDLDIVYGVQANRKGGLFEKLSGHLFYKTFNLLANVKVPESIITARLMSQLYVKNLIRFQEREIFIAGLCILNGFKSKEIKVAKSSLSPTTYSLQKKVALLFNGITSLSSRPLYLIFYMGAIITACAFAFAGVIFYKQVTHQIVIDGWTSISMMILVLGGFNIFCIGIIGIYLSKIYTETKKRPYSIIRKELNFEKQ